MHNFSYLGYSTVGDPLGIIPTGIKTHQWKPGINATLQEHISLATLTAAWVDVYILKTVIKKLNSNGWMDGDAAQYDHVWHTCRPKVFGSHLSWCRPLDLGMNSTQTVYIFVRVCYIYSIYIYILCEWCFVLVFILFFNVFFFLCGTFFSLDVFGLARLIRPGCLKFETSGQYDFWNCQKSRLQSTVSSPLQTGRWQKPHLYNLNGWFPSKTKQKRTLNTNNSISKLYIKILCVYIQCLYTY